MSIRPLEFFFRVFTVFLGYLRSRTSRDSESFLWILWYFCYLLSFYSARAYSHTVDVTDAVHTTTATAELAWFQIEIRRLCECDDDVQYFAVHIVLQEEYWRVCVPCAVHKHHSRRWLVISSFFLLSFVRALAHCFIFISEYDGWEINRTGLKIGCWVRARWIIICNGNNNKILLIAALRSKRSKVSRFLYNYNSKTFILFLFFIVMVSAGICFFFGLLFRMIWV